MRFCLIIINYNTKNNILDLLLSFQSIDVDIFICDNSTLHNEILNENELKYLNPRSQLLINVSNLGFGKTINLAIDKFEIKNKYDYFVLWNSDCLLDPVYFNQIKKYITSNKSNFVIAPRLYDGINYYYGSKLSWTKLSTSTIDKKNFDYSKSISWPTGAALFLPTTIIENNMIFDPYYFMYWEDADLMESLKRKKYIILNFLEDNNLYFTHKPGFSSSTNLINRYLWHLEGQIYFINKYVKGATFFKILIIIKYLSKSIFDLDLKRFKKILKFVIN